MSQPGPVPRALTLTRFGVPQRAVAQRPATAILVFSLLLAVPLIVLSFVDAGGLRTLFHYVGWIETAVAATVAAFVSIRGSSARVRAIRTGGAIALLLWLGAVLCWAAVTAAGQGAAPSVAEVLAGAVLAPGLYIVARSIRGRVSGAEQTAVFIDSVLIVGLLVMLLLHARGAVLVEFPSARALMAVAYPTAFVGLGASGMLAALSARYPLTWRGTGALIAGTIAIGLASLDWAAPGMGGPQSNELPSILVSVGTLLVGWGIVTLEERQSDDPRYVAKARFISRAIGPTVAGFVFLSLLAPVERKLEPIIDGVMIVTGALFVTRQALLLRERTTMLDEVTDLKVDNDRLVAELREELADHALDQRRMIQASRAAAVGELAAGVAHEVNNPLAAVLGFAELLIADTGPDDPRRGDLETIRAQALRARSIVRALGDFAQPGAPAPAPTDLGALVAGTVDLVRYKAERRNVRIEERYGELPELLVDPRAIQQAVLNVLANASQAVVPGGRIDVAVDATDRWVTIVVTDNGIGMTDTTVYRAFEPFFTGEDFESPENVASGLGLAVSRGLIEANGGTISLTSRPGLGTRVELRLPVQQARTA